MPDNDVGVNDLTKLKSLRLSRDKRDVAERLELLYRISNYGLFVNSYYDDESGQQIEGSSDFREFMRKFYMPNKPGLGGYWETNHFIVAEMMDYCIKRGLRQADWFWQDAIFIRFLNSLYGRGKKEFRRLLKLEIHDETKKETMSRCLDIVDEISIKTNRKKIEAIAKLVDEATSAR